MYNATIHKYTGDIHGLEMDNYHISVFFVGIKTLFQKLLDLLFVDLILQKQLNYVLMINKFNFCE